MISSELHVGLQQRFLPFFNKLGKLKIVSLSQILAELMINAMFY